ncbi:hypothetical protein [Parasitella parasitica]|uniref:Uncharacterized protein n=1 Tax=Parasitella parasitica TaxID=35722 RepID=A0A0B7NAR8_9FUNG|nr:hypothetical protein [Parasitella parasitica]
MRLPMLNSLVNEGVRIGFKQLVDPESFTIDIAQIMAEHARDGKQEGSSLEQKLASTDSLRVSHLINKINTKLGQINIETRSVRDITLGKLEVNGNVPAWCTSEGVIFDSWVPIDGRPEQESTSFLDLSLTSHPKYIIAKEKRSKTEHVNRYDLRSGQVAFVSDNESDLGRSKLITTQSRKNSADSGVSEASTLVEQEDQDVTDSDHDFYEPGEPISPEHESGILSIKSTRAKDLEISDPDLLTFKSRRHAHRTEKYDNTYSIAYINDRKVYQIRFKMSIADPLKQDSMAGTAVLKIGDLFDGPVRKVSACHCIYPGLPNYNIGLNVGTLVIQSITLRNLKKSMSSKKLKSAKATLSLNVEPRIQKVLQSNSLTQEKSSWEWSAGSSYLPLLMPYKTALHSMKEIVDYVLQEITLGLDNYTSETGKGNHNELPWISDEPNGQIILRFKFVPGFSPLYAHLPSFKTDILGADPFQKDNAWEKCICYDVCYRLGQAKLLEKQEHENDATKTIKPAVFNVFRSDFYMNHVLEQISTTRAIEVTNKAYQQSSARQSSGFDTLLASINVFTENRRSGYDFYKLERLEKEESLKQAQYLPTMMVLSHLLRPLIPTINIMSS